MAASRAKMISSPAQYGTCSSSFSAVAPKTLLMAERSQRPGRLAPNLETGLRCGHCCWAVHALFAVTWPASRRPQWRAQKDQWDIDWVSPLRRGLSMA